MEKLEVDSKSGSEEEFFDCLGEFSCFHSSPGSAHRFIAKSFIYDESFTFSLIFLFLFSPLNLLSRLVACGGRKKFNVLVKAQGTALRSLA